jgi:phosphopantothenoylcysteine decarboxylase/phosphopantothenate--cysteine ligase
MTPVASLAGRRVLLVVGGGIAAYKALELIRLLRRADCAVSCVLTAGGAHFVTPLSLQALSENTVHTDLWSLTGESEMGHIELSRAADLLVVAPASADLLARMAAGLASDLATTLLLATDKAVLVAPAMNVRMWEHSATQANLATLRARGVAVVGPDEGPMACGEYGFGRLAEPPALFDAIAAMLAAGPLAGRHALVTAGPTWEPVDPVRFLGNRSSGKQGFAVAEALAGLGARVTLVSGPVALPDPPGICVRRVETAVQMQALCEAALPADVAVCAAAVADWRAAHPADAKLKKGDAGPPALTLVENPDILAGLSHGPQRPRLVVGFAAETDDLAENASAKLLRKGCDWIVANDVRGVFGADDNSVLLVRADGTETWPRLPKAEVGRRLAARIAEALA